MDAGTSLLQQRAADDSGFQVQPPFPQRVIIRVSKAVFKTLGAPRSTVRMRAPRGERWTSSHALLSSRRKKTRGTVVRAVGVEPTRAVKPCGFSCRLRLSPPGRGVSERTPGLRSGLSLHRPPQDPGLRCCPSSLYTFPVRVLLRAWLGIAISGFPDFEQFCIAGFPGEHSSFA